jgi:mRNA-degrading endonuclease RelE of RelBE toxin-antitoxin system
VPPYTIKIEKAATKGLKKLQPAHRRSAIEFINGHLTETPLKLIPGKIKRLRGRY